ncbi:hypothetical protein Nepgr_009350 [Nepenthes gracilis]|uniref:Uncharacterized protein n=1 Tax=Nepenthes gracilis TaxID=150966 RepID=A0AAD3SAV7_NEPGR|nr:hypothetical protein Nepgr_009350 [Nepenthes gracilis]
MMPTQRCCVRHQLELRDANFATDSLVVDLRRLNRGSIFFPALLALPERQLAALVKPEEAVFLLYFLRLWWGLDALIICSWASVCCYDAWAASWAPC